MSIHQETLIAAPPQQVFEITCAAVSRRSRRSDFLDLAEASGVRHVTYLSAYGSDQAPPHS